PPRRLRHPLPRRPRGRAGERLLHDAHLLDAPDGDVSAATIRAGAADRRPAPPPRRAAPRRPSGPRRAARTGAPPRARARRARDRSTTVRAAPAPRAPGSAP